MDDFENMSGFSDEEAPEALRELRDKFVKAGENFDPEEEDPNKIPDVAKLNKF